MERLKNIKKSWLVAIFTGVLIVGAGIIVLANASVLQSIFEPKDFADLEDRYDSDIAPQTASGEGEGSDFADEDEDGEDRAGEDSQKALKVAYDEQTDRDGRDSLGRAEEDDADEDDPGQEKNPNAFEVTNDPGPGVVPVRPASGEEGDSRGNGGRGDEGDGGNGNDPGNGGNGKDPAGTGTPAAPGVTGPANTVTPAVPDPTGSPAPTDEPDPTSAPTPPGTPQPTQTPTPTQGPGTWEDEQLKPKEPVETEDGVLVGLTAVINREYYLGDGFQSSDAIVTATFRQSDGTRKKIAVPYGGKKGYSVKLSTKMVGTHTAAFTYLTETARAQYVVISSGVSVRYHGEDPKDGGIYALYFPGPLGGDQDTMDKLSDRNFHPTSGGTADLTDIHSRMVAYLSDESIKRRFLADASYKNTVFLEEEDGYLTTMLSGFRYYSSGSVEEEGPYVYYPVRNWGVNNLRNVVNVVIPVPGEYKIRCMVQDRDDLERYRGSQVLEQYTGAGRTLSVPMGVTDISLKGEQGDGTITSILLPESVGRIDFASVADCLPGLESYKVSGQGFYQVEDGVLYSRDKKTLYSVPAGKEQIKIPDTVTAIAGGAFYGSSVRELDIPDTVARLEAGCFGGFCGDAIRMAGEELPEIAPDTGCESKVLLRDSAWDILLKKGIFAFRDTDIIFGAMDESGAEIPEKTGIYRYDGRHILTLEDEAETLAGIPGDTYGRYSVAEGIAAVAEGAFAGAEGLSEISLPATLTELREGSLVFSGRVRDIYLASDMVGVSPRVFGDPAEGMEVPAVTVYVPEEQYDAYLEKWSRALDKTYGEGTAAALLRADDGTDIYENGARYRKMVENGVVSYQLLKVYAQDRTAFEVKDGTSLIREGAFGLCGSLEILYLPDTLQEVEAGAFKGCPDLQTVTVKEGSLLSGDVFDPLCAGVKIYEKGSKFTGFAYDSGIVYARTADGTYTLLDVPTDYDGTVVLYEKTSVLHDRAFKGCTRVEEIEISDQKALTQIGDLCFEDCTSLRNLYLDQADALEQVGERAFSSCSSLQELYLPDSLRTAGKGMCYDCTSLQTVRVKGIRQIGDEMFYNCQSLVSDGLSLEWGGIGAIGDRAFAYCSMLTEVPSMPVLTSLGERAFFTCQRIEAVALPETLSSMGEACFSECGSLTQVTMDGKLTGISRYCFYGCHGLVKMEFGRQQKETLQVVGVQAFGQCTSLESLDLSGCSALRQMGERTFAGCGLLTSVRLPGSLVKVPDHCFEDCGNLSVLTLLSDGVTGLGKTVFGETLSPFIHVWVKEERLAECREVYKDILDPVYGEGSTERILGAVDEDKEIIRGITFQLTDEGRVLQEASDGFQGSYTVPINTVRIEAGAFMGCTGLTEIVLPQGSVMSLGDRCFKGCTALESVGLYGDISWWGDETFMDCVSLNKIQIGSDVSNTTAGIGSRAFKGCIGLAGCESVLIMGKVPVLGDECFAGCRALEAIPMTTGARGSIEAIGERAFEGCTSLTQFLTSVFTGVKTIGAYAFSECDSLANPAVPANVISIGEGMFAGCDNLATVSFYCTLEEYPKECFKDCPKLTRTGGVAGALSGLRRIGESAYEGCISLRTNDSWDLGRYSGLEEIGAYAFRGCTDMTEIVLAATVESIGEGAFDGCSQVGQMTLYPVRPPQIGAISLDTLSQAFCIRVPDSQADGDSVYKAYLEVFAGMFGQSRAYAILDSVSDGAKDRGSLPSVSESMQPEDLTGDMEQAADRDEAEEDDEESGEAEKKEIEETVQ